MFDLNADYISDYICLAPAPLAFERTMECKILSRQIFEKPVLDLGCGDGLFAKVLFNEKVDVGIDPNAKELEHARKLGIYNQLIQCTGDRIPCADAHFNTIFSNSVVEHIPDLQPILEECYRLLTSTGRLYLTVPSDKFDEYTWVSQFLMRAGLTKTRSRYQRQFNQFWRHYHYFSLEKWSEIVRDSGFEVVEAYTYGSKNICLLNDFMVPFCLPGFFSKKLLNRWTSFPAVRRWALSPFMKQIRLLLQSASKCRDGGLVFLSLKKVAV